MFFDKPNQWQSPCETPFREIFPNKERRQRVTYVRLQKGRVWWMLNAYCRGHGKLFSIFSIPTLRTTTVVEGHRVRMSKYWVHTVGIGDMVWILGFYGINRELFFRVYSVEANGLVFFLCCSVQEVDTVMSTIASYGYNESFDTQQQVIWRHFVDFTIGLNSAINPMVYLVTNRRYRDALIHSFKSLKFGSPSRSPVGNIVSEREAVRHGQSTSRLWGFL